MSVKRSLMRAESHRRIAEMLLDYAGQIASFASLVMLVWLSILRWTRIRSVGELLDWCNII